jgi:hypothetical protein
MAGADATGLDATAADATALDATALDAGALAASALLGAGAELDAIETLGIAPPGDATVPGRAQPPAIKTAPANTATGRSIPITSGQERRAIAAGCVGGQPSPHRYRSLSVLQSRVPQRNSSLTRELLLCGAHLHL